MPENSNEDKIKLYLDNVNDVFSYESSEICCNNDNISQKHSLDSVHSNSTNSKNLSLPSSTDYISTSLVSEDQLYLDQVDKVYQPLKNLDLILPFENNQKSMKDGGCSTESNGSAVSDVIKPLPPIVFQINPAIESRDNSKTEKSCRKLTNQRSYYDMNIDISDLDITNNDDKECISSSDTDYSPSDNYSSTYSDNVEDNNLHEKLCSEEQQIYTQVKVHLV